jgi:hypothetical protein
MRNRLRLLCAFVCLVAPSHLLHAQFREPTPEELHMTSDPKAPGAAAVYLYLEEKTDDAVPYHSFYARIKVLTEKGKELATVHVPYEKGQFTVAAIRGRTIHPDGTIVPLQAKPTDLMTYRGGGRQFNDKTFTLPSVEVGSILEYYLQLRYEDGASPPEWVIQQPYFVHKAHYFFNPVFNIGQDVVDKHGQVAGGLMYATRLPYGGQVAEDSIHRYTLDVADVPPMPTGDYMPPVNNLRESVIFFYTNANSGPEFWEREGKYWAKNAERFTANSGVIKKAAADIVASGDSDEVKARKIYAAVMKLDNTDFSGTTAPPKTKGNKDAASVWKQQRGTSDEITLLYIALARAAGVKAWPMQVVNRDRALYEPTNLSTEQFDDYIAIVELGGKEVYLDPGQKMAGFGVVHWKHEIAKGFKLTDKGVSIEETPAGPAKAASVQRFGDVGIDDKGTVTGTARFVFGGLEALLWRQLALLEQKDALAKDFSDYLDESLPEGVKGELDHFDGLAEFEGDLTAQIKLTGTLGATTAKRVIVPAFFFEARGKHPFVDEDSREVPVDLRYATMEQDDVTYRLPTGMKIASIPRNDDIAWAGRLGLTVALKQGDGTVNVKRSFVRAAAMFDPSLYGNLRYIYRRISNSDQQQIVLERGTETAAN